MVLYKDQIRKDSRDHVAGVPFVEQGINLCRLPSGLICMGCCGFDFAANLSTDQKRVFLEAIKKSTQEYATFKDHQSYKRRYDPDDLHNCGMCRQLIMREKEDVDTLLPRKHLDVYCPLHPSQNNGNELRKGECDPEYMCKAQRVYHGQMDEKTRKEFVEFILAKDLDWFDYSVQMYSDSLLGEFLQWKSSKS